MPRRSAPREPLGTGDLQRRLPPCLPRSGPVHIVAPMPDSGRTVAHARVMALLTFVSRILGLAREWAFAYYLGTGELLSAFRLAFMVPNLARRLFGEGALSAAMIPVLSESLQRRGEGPSRALFGALLVRLLAVLVAILLVAELVVAVWRSFDGDLALALTAVLLPYMVLICVVAVAGGALNVRERFAVPAAAPIILNLSILAAVLGGGALMGWSGQQLVCAACGGVLVAGVVQLIAIGAALRAASFWPSFSARSDPGVGKVVALMGPMMLGLSAVQINALADYVIAYLFISEGGERVGPAVLGYAHFLYQMPLGVFGIAIATAIFPVVSRMAASDDREGLIDVVTRGLRLSFFVALPASIGLMFVAWPLVATLYQGNGEFDASSTDRVAGTLVFYAAGLVAYFIQHIIARVFYAMHDSKTPARIAMIMVVINLGLNLALVGPMQERGLALATAICAAVQVVWLISRLGGTGLLLPWRSLGAAGAKVVVAAGAMAAALTVQMVWLPIPATEGHKPWMQLAAMIVVGVAVYTGAAKLLRIPELGDLLRRGRGSA